MRTTTNNSPVETIPTARVVRERLSAALIEVQLLRDLLRVAERKDRFATKWRASEKEGTDAAR